MAERRRGLGKGLGALIPSGPDTPDILAPRPKGRSRPVDVFFNPRGEDPDGQAEPPGPTGLVRVPGATFQMVDVDAIKPNPRQPRQVFDEDDLAELTASIKEVGLLQPIVVRPVGGDFELVMGERRWRATRAAGLKVIPAIVRGTADADLLRDALLENLHRAQLNPLEEAAAYRQMLDDFDCTQEALASRLARSRPQIANTLRLLKLPPPVQRRVAAGVISAGHARALLAIESAEAMERMANRIVAEGLSVRTTEQLVAIGDVPGEPKTPQAKAKARPGGHTEALDALQERLTDHLDTRVSVALGKQRGRITIEFASVEDLDRIVKLISPQDPGLLAAGA